MPLEQSERHKAMKIRLSKLDKLFSRWVRLQAGGACEYCGHEAKLQMSHFIGRRCRAVRYDPDNVAAVCFSCHQYLGENPYKHVAFFRKRLGSERLEALVIRAETAMPRGQRLKQEAALMARLKALVKGRGRRHILRSHNR